MKVVLDWYEVSRAALVGVSRNVEASRRGCVSARKIEDEWSAHINGALGECAFAKASGMYWSGSVNTFKAADIGDNIQVRTRTRHEYDLIVRDSDKDGDVYVLVTGGPNEFLVHGWIPCADAKDQRYAANYGGYGQAYFVPKADLRPIEELLERQKSEVNK